MSEYFPEPKSLGKVKVELHLCRIMQRKEISIIRQESSFTKTVHLADLKPHVEQLDVHKLKFFQLT